MTKAELIQTALDARARAYCPYSRFAVGAALECSDGTVYTGCNIENASFPAGICAERTATAKAVSEGHHDFVRLAIAGSSEAACTPCGICRQVLMEFAPKLEILCVGDNGQILETTLDALLPYGFCSAQLDVN